MGSFGGTKLVIAVAICLLSAAAVLSGGATDGSGRHDARGSEPQSAEAFLSSLGINIHIDQGYAPQSYVAPLKFLGVRAVRTGAWNVQGSISVSRQTGVLVDIFQYGGTVQDFLAAGRALAAANGLLSFEGPNEPNNFPMMYNGKQGGGQGTWLPVAQFQRDVYEAVKSDPVLKRFPVFSPSETGAENDNVGLQFLTIPKGAGALLPDGTRFADFVNPHNYVIGNGHKYGDNQAWNAADPTLDERWDGLYGNNGVTWHKRFRGYDKTQLLTVPRVTTETGFASVNDYGGEKVQGAVLVNTYLAQFKRGFRYTFIYQLRDGEGGEDSFGIFDRQSRPKAAATYIHNLTAILADRAHGAASGRLNYSIANEPATVHDLLLQKSDGAFELVVWGERKSGADSVIVDLGGQRTTVNFYDVTVGTSPVQTLNNVKAVPLTLTDHALVLEVAN